MQQRINRRDVVLLAPGKHLVIEELVRWMAACMISHESPQSVLNLSKRQAF